MNRVFRFRILGASLLAVGLCLLIVSSVAFSNSHDAEIGKETAQGEGTETDPVDAILGKFLPPSSNIAPGGAELGRMDYELYRLLGRSKTFSGDAPAGSAVELIRIASRTREKEIDLTALEMHMKVSLAEIGKNREIETYRTWTRAGIVVALVVGLIAVLSVILWVIRKMSGYTVRDLLNVTGLVLIVFAISFAVVVTDTTEALSASIGVLGTIAGYLFGSLKKEQ